MKEFLSIQPDVAAALADHRPVVALESTIVSHGMPYPQNLETARAAEAIIRERGAVPATIAVLDGRIRVGLDDEDLEALASAKDVMKLSRRDLPICLAAGRSGATTVATTMIGAKLAGIGVFATGGVGGVHRGDAMDISADLQELARTNVAVVCAGAKAILDLPRTREYLETHGVPVIGFRSDDFPAFYTRSSGLPVDARLDEAAEVARLMDVKWRLGLNGGLVVANPIPEEHALDDAAIGKAIAEALAEADVQGVAGKDATPFLLARLERLTGGESLKANVALVKHNAAVAADIAVAWAEIARQHAKELPRRHDRRQIPHTL